MANSNKLQGCVIVSAEKHSFGVVELLAQRVRNRIDLTYYAHPHEIDVQRHRFVIVFSTKDLALVVKTFFVRSAPPPLLIHIDDPHVINQMDYAARYPGLTIAPIQQANLTDKEDTLKIALFHEIIKSLAFGEAHDAPQPPAHQRTGAADHKQAHPRNGNQGPH